MNEETITLTLKELDIITEAMLIVSRQYPLSWNNNGLDEKTLRKLRDAWYKAFETERSNNGEEESWS